MVIHCDECSKYYDDEFRSTTCPHLTFPVNDGHNNFKRHYESYLSFDPPLINKKGEK